MNNLDQNYQFGLALALAQDKVYVSYPILNASNERLDSSIYYKRLFDYVDSEFEQHDLPEQFNDLLSFITSADASLGYLSYINSIDSSKEIDELLRITHEQSPQKTEIVLQANEFNNQPEDIGQELAEKLYGQNLNSSVSQLETFYENSYEYFFNLWFEITSST